MIITVANSPLIRMLILSTSVSLWGGCSTVQESPQETTVSPVLTTAKESCEDSGRLALDGSVAEGNTTLMGDDVTPSCDEGSGGNDAVYRFTLTEAAKIDIVLTGYDAILALYKVSGNTTESDATVCNATTEISCKDAIDDTGERLVEYNLTAGDYLLVVDTFVDVADNVNADGGAAYTLQVNVTAPECSPDDLESDAPNDPNTGNNTPISATTVGADEINSTALVDTETGDLFALSLNICPDDIDYYRVSHMGGALGGQITAEPSSTSLTGTWFSAITGTNADGDTEYTLGALLGVNDIGTQERGYYFYKVNGSDVGTFGTDYSFIVSHGCHADEADSVNVQADDQQLNTAPLLLTTTDSPLERSLCGDDADGFIINSIIPGDVTVTLAGGEPLLVEVYPVEAGSQASDPEVLGAVLTAATDYITTTTSTTTAPPRDRTIVFSNIGKYFIRLKLGSDQTELHYTFAAQFAATTAIPANDQLCSPANPVALTPVSLTAAPTAATMGTPIIGQTYSASHHVSGSCNGDADITAGSTTGPAADLFYTLHVAQPGDIQIDFDGEESGFQGAVYVLHEPTTCPSDLSTLTPVKQGGEPICKTGDKFSVKLKNIAAGDYIVVVDGVYTPQQNLFGIFNIPESTSEGIFNLTTYEYPQGFPAPTVCTDAPELAIPTVATRPTIVEVDTSALNNQLTDYGTCSDGGSANEIVYKLIPSTDQALYLSTSGYDTVLAVRTADCEFGAELACNDDIGGADPQNPDLGSGVAINVLAGTVYYVIVDGYSAQDNGALTLSVNIGVAPL